MNLKNIMDGIKNSIVGFSKEMTESRPVSSIKIIAMIAMVVDHIGHLFFPGVTALRIIGRLALPIFAWEVAQGASRTRNFSSYLTRIAVIAFVSQPLFMQVYPHDWNICFNLAYTLVVVWVAQQIQGLNKWLWILIAYILASHHIDGGRYAMAIAVITLFIPHQFFRYLFLILVTIKIAMGTWWVNYFYLLSIAAIFLYERCKWDIKLPRYASYLFYPVQWAILLLILKLLGMPVLQYNAAEYAPQTPW